MTISPQPVQPWASLDSWAARHTPAVPLLHAHSPPHTPRRRPRPASLCAWPAPRSRCGAQRRCWPSARCWRCTTCSSTCSWRMGASSCGGWPATPWCSWWAARLHAPPGSVVPLLPSGSRAAWALRCLATLCALHVATPLRRQCPPLPLALHPPPRAHPPALRFPLQHCSEPADEAGQEEAARWTEHPAIVASVLEPGAPGGPRLRDIPLEATYGRYASVGRGGRPATVGRSGWPVRHDMGVSPCSAPLAC